MIKVAVELIHTRLAKLADFRMEKNAVRVGAAGKELADGGVWSYADGLIVLNGNHR